MFEPKLTAAHRFAFTVSAIVTLTLAVFFAAVILTNLDMPAPALTALLCGIVFCLGWSGVAGWIARKGILNFKTYFAAVLALTVFLTLGVSISFMHIAIQLPMEKKILGVQIIVCFLPFLIIGQTGVLLGYMWLVHLENARKILELQYRLAEIAEKVTNITPK